MDGDMLVRENLTRVFEGLDNNKAVYCVHHKHVTETTVKMDGQVQTKYARKNWSSLMIFNCDHEANKALTLDTINMLPGRDLHRFCWLDDEEIGKLDHKWNFLVGHSDPSIDPAVVHFTSGTPDMPGYENVPYADEWRNELRRWAL
jgi:lipopolysaccharide biosynthesis glycosyltransferase